VTSRGLEILDAADCYILLRSRSLGRVGVILAGEIVILPVYYAVLDDDIVFRTDLGMKLTAAVLGTRVAFEVDNAVPAWSVLVSGHAHEIRESAERYVARERLGHDWPAGERESLVRVRAERVTGRRLRPPA
jgi:nitroimidazol reductase NimA-like FMN-containing flavoprotein (pyridoxamine 5'-phosphate oxidase superfamily)